ncbi:hypothetical protein ACHAPJ_008323 [Fusarium lateritium]
MFSKIPSAFYPGLGLLMLVQHRRTPRLTMTPILDDGYVVDTTPGKASAGTIKDNDGTQVAHFKPLSDKLDRLEVRLSGPPIGLETGAYPFLPDTAYNINAKNALETDQARFDLYVRTRIPGVYIGKEPLTEKEQSQLEETAGSEEKWLKMIKLDINNEKDREIGRGRLRKALFADTTEALHQDGRWLERRQTDALASDPYFSPEELQYVRTKWATSKDFLDLYGYKFNRSEDCEKAAAQIREMMEEDEEWKSGAVKRAPLPAARAEHVKKFIFNPHGTEDQTGWYREGEMNDNGSIRVATDRSWFEDDYMSFSSVIYHGADEPWVMDVIDDKVQAPGMSMDKEGFTFTFGIGTVRLKTKRSHNKGGTKSQGEIVLKNVLHAPHYICNVIGGNIAEDGYVVTLDPNPEKPNAGIIRDKDGAQMAHLKRLTRPNRQIEVRLSGPPHGPEVGESPFHPEVAYEIKAKWQPYERERLETYIATRDPGVEIGEKPFTEEEKEWFKWRRMDFERDLERRCGPRAANEEFQKKMRTEYRYEKIKNPNQNLFDKFVGFKECRVCDHAFPPKEQRYIRACFGSTKEFMDKYGYTYYKTEEHEQAAIQAKEIMKKDPDMEDAQRFGEDEESEWEDEDEDESEIEYQDDGIWGHYQYEFDVDDVYGPEYARSWGSLDDIECQYMGRLGPDDCPCTDCIGRRIMMESDSD